MTDEQHRMLRNINRHLNELAAELNKDGVELKVLEAFSTARKWGGEYRKQTFEVSVKQ